MNVFYREKISTDSIWFGMLAIYVVTGYFAQDVLLPATINSLILYVFLAYSVLTMLMRRRVRLSPIVYWEMVCMLLAFVAMLYSPSFSILSGTYYAMLVNFVIVFILTQMPWTRKRFNMIMKTFVVSAAGLIVALALTGNLTDSSASGRLGQELMGNANILATMLMVGAIYSTWIFLSVNEKGIKILSLISLLVIYFGMFLSGGRKYIVVPIIFLYIIMLNKKDKMGRRHMIRTTLVTFAAVIAVYLLIMKVSFFYEVIGYRFESFFQLFNGGVTDGSTEKRMMMIEAAWERWQKSPLWGYGFDSFKYYNATNVTGHQYYSHNNFVELLYNQGLLGFVAYYSFYAYLFYKACRINDTLSKGFGLGIVVSLLFFEYFGITYSVTPAQFMLFLGFTNLKCGMKSANE